MSTTVCSVTCHQLCNLRSCSGYMKPFRTISGLILSHFVVGGGDSVGRSSITLSDSAIALTHRSLLIRLGLNPADPISPYSLHAFSNSVIPLWQSGIRERVYWKCRRRSATFAVTSKVVGDWRKFSDELRFDSSRSPGSYPSCACF